MRQVKGTEEEGVISELAVRSMAKAIYSTKNIGHYGLGFKNYTHFTSPIRRYADLLVHRVLDKNLISKSGKNYSLDQLTKNLRTYFCNRTNSYGCRTPFC